MDIIHYALSEISAQIPPQLLEKVYSNKDSYGFQTLSVADSIKKNVINCRVKRDCDIIGGQQLYISTDRAINHIELNRTDTNLITQKSIFVFDDNAWDGNELIAVIDFSNGFPGPSGGCMSGCSSDAMTPNEIQSMYGQPDGLHGGIYGAAMKNAVREHNRWTTPNIGGSTKLRIVGTNSIAIIDSMPNPRGYFTVIVGHDKNLYDMQPRNAISFSKMAVAAVKADIYNSTILTLGQGDAERGFVLNSLADIISGYSSAEEEYQTLRGTWGARAFENDPLRHDEFITDQISFTDFDF